MKDYELQFFDGFFMQHWKLKAADGLDSQVKAKAYMTSQGCESTWKAGEWSIERIYD